MLVAPPKRRTGGRTTPKGTKPGQLPRATSPSPSASRPATSTNVGASARYTPPTPRALTESPRWVPILMLALLAVGVVLIIARYLLNESVGNWLVFVGLGCILGGLYTATRWR